MRKVRTVAGAAPPVANMTAAQHPAARVGPFLVALFAAASTFAQDLPLVVGPPIVVTATRIPQKLSNVLQAVTVITAQDIADAGQTTLPELLQRLGGVEITSNGGAGQTSAVFIRGANSSHTLVLVDGMRIGSATAGTTPIENIPLDQIDRIEIVSAPASSIYGSDAIGGVIQIFTKGARASPSASIVAGVGSYRTSSLSASVGGTSDSNDFSAVVGYSNSDGFDATTPDIPFDQHNDDRDGYRNVNFSARFSHHFNLDNEAGISALYSEGRTHFDSGPTTDDQNHEKLTSYAAYTQNQLTPGWQSLLRVGSGRDDSTITGAFPGAFRTDQGQATWQNTIDAAGGKVLAGLEYLVQKVASDVDYTNTRRTVRSAFAGFGGEYGAQAIQFNVRADDNSQFGNHVTGSGAYGYRFGEGFRLRASAGNAFHAPTFNDLYYPGFSNPDLKPERSTSAEMAIDYQRGDHQFAFTYFENRISDLIVFDFDTFLPQNLAKAKIRGGELSYQGRLYDALVRAKLTLQDPIDATTGLQLPRRSRQFGSLVVTRPWGPWNGGVEVVGSGVRFDSTTEDPSTRLGGYALVNLFINRSLAPQWSIELRWNNVLNKEYELVQFYNTPRSNVFLSVTWMPSR